MGILSPSADERVKNITFSEQAMHLELRDGRTLSVPLSWYPRLLHATPEQRGNYEVGPEGYEIHWPDVDEDLHTVGMLRGLPAPKGSIPEGMRRIKFAAAQEPRVKISVSEECKRGDCDQCRGLLKLPGHGTVLCVHGCHLAKNRNQ